MKNYLARLRTFSKSHRQYRQEGILVYWTWQVQNSQDRYGKGGDYDKNKGME